MALFPLTEFHLSKYNLSDDDDDFNDLKIKVGFGKYHNLDLIDVLLYHREYFEWAVENVSNFAYRYKNNVEYISKVRSAQEKHHHDMYSYSGSFDLYEDEYLQHSSNPIGNR